MPHIAEHVKVKPEPLVISAPIDRLAYVSAHRRRGPMGLDGAA